MNSFKHVLRTRLFAVWSLMMLGISMLAIILLFWDFAAPKAPETERLFEIIDTCICLFFLIDFLVLLSRSEKKMNYMRTWGVFDLLSCVPLYGQFRVFRVGRIFRLIRAARTLRAGIQGTTHPDGALISVVFMFISMWFSGAFFLLAVEQGVPDSTIHSAGDALWCALVTLATVGYGDYVPVTTGGRIVAGILMTVGVSAFGVFTGCIASYFTHRGSEAIEDDKILHDLHKQLQQLNEKIDRLEGLDHSKSPSKN